MIKTNTFIEQTLIGVVETQIRENRPEITRKTFERLQRNGCTSQAAKEKIAFVALRHIYEVMNNGATFSSTQFEDDLNNLK